MAHLYRLIGLCFVAVMFMAGAPKAHALVPMGYQCQIDGLSGSTWSDTCQAAADAVTGKFATQPTTASCNISYPDGAPCRFGNSSGNFSRDVTYRAACPANSVQSGDTCNCKSGFVEQAGKCVPPAEDPEGASAFCRGMGAVKAAWKQTGRTSGSTPSTSCYMPYPPFTGPDASKGCVTNIGDSVAVPNADGSRTWSATGVATGATCTSGGTSEGGTGTGGPGGSGNGANPPTAAPNPCPNGFPGTVNGMTVCAAPVPDNGVDSTVRSSSTAADGTRSDVVEETKCAGGTCVTNTTVNNYNSSGGSIGTNTSSSTQPIKSLCAKSPGNQVCSATGLAPTGNTGPGTGNTGNTGTGAGTGAGCDTSTGKGCAGNGSGGSGGSEGGGESSFSGTCAAGFKAVSEDAVTNAMAEEQYRRNCEVLRKDTDEAKAVEAVSDKDGKTRAENPNDAEVKIGSSNFDQSDALGGGGGCQLDKTITVAKMQVTLPFNAICNPLAALGQLLVAVSLLGAMVIMTRG